MMTKDQVDVIKQRERILYSKLEILDENMHVIRELTGFLKSGDYSIFAKVGERRTCDIELVIGEDTIPSPSSPIWINKRFRTYVGIKHLAKDEVVWFPIGTFVITKPQQEITITGENTLSISGVDFVALIDDTLGGSLGTQVIVTHGDYVHNTLQNIFTEFTNFDTNIQETECKIPYEIERDPDDSLWDLIEEILDLYLHYEGFFDVNGTFIYQKMSDLITDAVVWDFSVPENKLIKSIVVNYKWDDVRNQITVNGKDDDGVYPSYTTAALSTNEAWADCPYTVDKLGESKALDYVMQGDIVTTAWSLIEAETDTESALYKFKTLAEENNWDAQTCVDKTIGEDVRSYLVGIISAKDLKAKFEEYKLGDEFDDFINTEEINDYKYNPRSLTITESDYYKVEQCITRAQYELDTRLSGAEEIKLTCVPIYGLDVNQLIYLDETVNNTEVKGKYCIDEINCKLGVSGEMSITAHKVTKSRFTFDQALLYQKEDENEEVKEDSSGTVTTDTSSGSTTTTTTIINNVLDSALVRHYNLTLEEQKEICDLITITNRDLRIVTNDSRLQYFKEELMRDANGNWYTETYSIGQDLLQNKGWLDDSGASTTFPSTSFWDKHSTLKYTVSRKIAGKLKYSYLPKQVMEVYSLTEDEAKEIVWYGISFKNYFNRSSSKNDDGEVFIRRFINCYVGASGASLTICDSYKGTYNVLSRDADGNWYTDLRNYGKKLFFIASDSTEVSKARWLNKMFIF